MNPAPLRVLIVDDEPPARARARRLLAEASDVEIVGEAGSAAEARERVAATRPDLLLLDVQMPGEDGFALLGSLEPRPGVIFATAYDHYAVRAFEEHAIDYLLKPFRAERLAVALERARADLARPADWSRRIEAMLSGLAGGGGVAGYLERFTVRIGTRQVILRSEDVRWFGAEDKLVFAAVDGDRHYVNLTLDQLEQRLDPRRFTRVHRAAIVNLDHAVALHRAFAGGFRLQLDDRDRTEVPVSRQRARKLRERLAP